MSSVSDGRVSPISVTAIFPPPSVIVLAAGGEVGRFSHVHSGSRRVWALSGGKVDADSPAVDIEAVTFLPGFPSVDEVLVSDESEAAASTGHPV